MVQVLEMLMRRVWKIFCNSEVRSIRYISLVHAHIQTTHTVRDTNYKLHKISLKGCLGGLVKTWSIVDKEIKICAYVAF